MFESFIILRTATSGIVNNPSEKLHGALIHLFTRRFPISTIHGSEKVQFCLSPLYEARTLEMVREFHKDKQYLFRFATLDKDIANELNVQLAVEPTITLHDVSFEVERVITCNSFTFQKSEMDTLYCVSPLTFRVEKNVNLPLPVPERMAKSLGRILKREVELPPIQEFFGGTKALSFSHYVMVGFVGYVKFSKPARELVLAHFLGLGYSTARGFGSVLVKGVYPSSEEIGHLHACFMNHEEKRYRD